MPMPSPDYGRARRRQPRVSQLGLVHGPGAHREANAGTRTQVGEAKGRLHKRIVRRRAGVPQAVTGLPNVRTGIDREGYTGGVLPAATACQTIDIASLRAFDRSVLYFQGGPLGSV